MAGPWGGVGVDWYSESGDAGEQWWYGGLRTTQEEGKKKGRRGRE